jgi:hypothetical protein
MLKPTIFKRNFSKASKEKNWRVAAHRFPPVPQGKKCSMAMILPEIQESMKTTYLFIFSQQILANRQ